MSLPAGLAIRPIRSGDDATMAAIIRAAYDPVLPAVAADASHALRLAARLAA